MAVIDENRNWSEGEDKRYRLAVDAAEIGIFEWDMVSDRFVHSPIMATRFGRTGEENINRLIFFGSNSS